MFPFSDSSSLCTCTVQPGPSGPFLLMQRSHPTFVFTPLTPLPPTSYFLHLFHFRPPFMLLAVFLRYISCFLLSLSDSLVVLQWNTGGLRATSTGILHFILSCTVDLICIQESNLNSSSSFPIPGFSAL